MVSVSRTGLLLFGLIAIVGISTAGIAVADTETAVPEADQSLTALDSSQIDVALDDAASEGDSVSIELTVSGGEDSPDSVDGHEFEITYDDSILEPEYDGGDSITLQHDGGSAEYLIGGNPGDGTVVFSTLDSPELPFGSEGEGGETLDFTVVTDEETQTSVSATASFDTAAGGEYTVSYSPATVTVNDYSGTSNGDDSTDGGEGDDSTDDGETADGDTTSDSDSGAADDGADTTEADTADDDGPGFGVGSALASFGAIGYLLKRRLAIDE